MQLVENKSLTYTIAAEPNDCRDSRLDAFFNRGYERWKDDEGNTNANKLIESIEEFGRLALDTEYEPDPTDEPLVDDPAVLSILATHSAYCAQKHEIFENTPPRNIKPVKDIRDLAGTVFQQLLRSDESVPLRALGEILFAKEFNEHPYPGRVCNSIVTEPSFADSKTYLEIPLPAATKETFVTTDVNGRSKVESHLHNNSVYVPIDELYKKFSNRWETSFKQLLSYKKQSLTGEEKEWLLKNEDELSEKIESFDRSNHREKLYEGWNPEYEKLRLLVRAVSNAPDEVATLGDELTAAEIYEALEREEVNDYEEKAARALNGARQIAQFLSSQSDHDSIEIVENVEKNKYKITPLGGSAKDLTITELEDFFELPCFQNIMERLREEGPTRPALYNFVRSAAWIPKYYNQPGHDELVEDMKDVLSQFDWYDEYTTEYQVRWELEHGSIDGHDPLPMNCDNDDMQLFCIGKDECPYSIYGSLNFASEMYDLLDDITPD